MTHLSGIRHALDLHLALFGPSNEDLADPLTWLFSVTHWGTSPKFLATLRKSASDIDLNISSLQQVQSAGSPLSAELHQWFTSVAPKGVGLFSGSGGTDLVGGSMFSISINFVSYYPRQVLTIGPSRGGKPDEQCLCRGNRWPEPRDEG